MGVNFILGDLDGQLKPIFDSWSDAMKVNDIRTSHFLQEMAGGVHVKLTVYRRGTDPQLFRSYMSLYDAINQLDPDQHSQRSREYVETCNAVQGIVHIVADRYPAYDGEYDIHLVLSHRMRIEINAMVNEILAARHEPKLFLESDGGKSGDIMLPQNMWIWHGMELLCYTQKYSKKYPVNGGVYVVESWDHAHVTIRLHEDYMPQFDKDCKLDDDEDVDGAPAITAEDDASDPEDLGGDAGEHDVQPPPAKRAKLAKNKEKGLYTLSYEKASQCLRPQHALVYASIQGRTLRDKHIALLDWQKPMFTLRHLNVAISRATHGKFVHVLHAQEERDLLNKYRTLVQSLSV